MELRIEPRQCLIKVAGAAIILNLAVACSKPTAKPIPVFSKTGFSNASLMFEIDDEAYVAMTTVEFHSTEPTSQNAAMKVRISGPIVVQKYESVRGKDWIDGIRAMNMGGPWETTQGVSIPAGRIAFLGKDGTVKEVGAFNRERELALHGNWEADPCGKALLGELLGEKSSVHDELKQLPK